MCVVGSELIQKYLGDGNKLFKELFRAPILTLLVDFIDEIDTYGTKRCLNEGSGYIWPIFCSSLMMLNLINMLTLGIF